MQNPFIEICPEDEGLRNTGIDCDCLETPLKIPVLSDGFKFPSIADFKNRNSWRDAIAAKNLVPLFEAYELADASTADKKFETGNFSRTVEKGVEKITFEFMASDAVYNALKGYENNSKYDEIFEFNQGDDYSGVFDVDGVQVKGRKIKSISFTKVRALAAKVPHIKCEIVYKDKDDVRSSVRVKSELTEDDLFGIVDVNLVLVSQTVDDVFVQVTTGCSNDTFVNSLTIDNFLITNQDGDVVSFTLVPVNSNNAYQLVFDAPATQNDVYTITTNGVVVQTDIMYEGNSITVNF